MRKLWKYLFLGVMLVLPISETSARDLSNRIVVIDPGHGGRDSGAYWPFEGVNLRESDLVLDISQRISQSLSQHGINVHMTRTTDVYLTLHARAQFANEQNADVFVSVHANAFSNPTANGIETFYFGGRSHAQNSRALATAIQNRKVGALGLRNRGVFSRGFQVLVQTQMPAVLSEIGFMSNPHDMSVIASEEGRAASARAIYEGILEFLQTYEPAPPLEVTQVVTAPPVQTGSTGTVTASSLNVRTGPSTGHQIIGGLMRNATVTILESRDGWHRIQSGQTTGWVSGDFVSIGEAPAPVVPPTAPVAVAGNQGTVTAGVLNVRSGPSMGHAVLSTLRSGTVVEILETSDGWHRVQQGWISADFVRVGETVTNVVTAPPPATVTATQTGTVTAGVLNVRTGPSMGHGVTTTLSRNASVTILETRDGWHRVQSGSITGWVSGDFVNIGGSSAPTETVTTTRTGTVTATGLNIRAGASTGHGIIGSLRRDERVTILETRNGWHQIQLPHGTGWVSGDFVQVEVVL